MSTLSKLVATRLATARYVQSSARINTDPIARAVADEVPELKVSEVRHLIDALTAHLVRKSDAMEAAEGVYTREQGDDPKVRHKRDTAATALATVIAGFREALRGTFGADAVELYGLRGTTPVRPDLLLDTGANAVRLLREHPAPAPLKSWMALDVAALADELEVHVEALRTALAETADEERELHLAKTARDAAVEEWTRFYPGIGAMLEGLYRIAGRADLAERIRPTRRRAEGHEAGSFDDAAEPPLTEPATPPETPAEPEPA